MSRLGPRDVVDLARDIHAGARWRRSWRDPWRWRWVAFAGLVVMAVAAVVLAWRAA